MLVKRQETAYAKLFTLFRGIYNQLQKFHALKGPESPLMELYTSVLLFLVFFHVPRTSSTILEEQDINCQRIKLQLPSSYSCEKRARNFERTKMGITNVWPHIVEGLK